METREIINELTRQKIVLQNNRDKLVKAREFGMAEITKIRIETYEGIIEFFESKV